MARVSLWTPVFAVSLWTLVFALSGVRGLFVIRGADTDCSQQGMNCSLGPIPGNCLDPDWVKSHPYTPAAPEKLELKISRRTDPGGNLLPVINASWSLKDDGSISYLKASELHVVVVSTNQNFCVRLSFNNHLSMRSPSGEQWRLSSDVLVVEPGQIYRVSVENVPKAELDHSSSRVGRQITVPDCSHSEMKLTRPCIQRGALWRPNITVSRSSPEVLTVEFSPDRLSGSYMVFCRCDASPHTWIKTPDQIGSRLRASFLIDFVWVRSCCRFHIEIKPFFAGCGNDCPRRKILHDFCSKPSPAPSVGSWSPLSVILGVVAVLLLTVASGVCVVIFCRQKGAKQHSAAEKDGLLEKRRLEKHRLEEHPRLLLIYSRDHPLFLQVVLQLAAFLQAHCGVKVLLDLLDSAVVSQVGLMRWLELQRNEMAAHDKILVLCSRGLRAKWRAMCGRGHVTPRPDDLIGPFLSLFLSDMHQPGSMSRYIAAYFSDIASESDVPSFFDIAVKYKLMKHFEELYFRVLDREKYEPRRVNRIEGIGPDEFSACPSGGHLRAAIENFQVFQAENPDWFEKGSVEEVHELGLFLDDSPQQLRSIKIKECVPIVKEGCVILTNDVLAENGSNLYIIAPELNTEVSLSQNQPVLCPAASFVLEFLPDARPSVDMFQSVVMEQEEPEPVESEVEPEARFEFQSSEPEERDEAEVSVKSGDQSAVDPDGSQLTGASLGQSEAGVAGFPSSKVNTSGSDQGYGSKAWTEANSEELSALLQLQRELMSDVCFMDPR